MTLERSSLLLSFDLRDYFSTRARIIPVGVQPQANAVGRISPGWSRDAVLLPESFIRDIPELAPSAPLFMTSGVSPAAQMYPNVNLTVTKKKEINHQKRLILLE